MKQETYTFEERTIAQFKAMELKKRGYHVTKLIEEDELENEIILAFGYNDPATNVLESDIEYLQNVNTEDFDFIYWN